MITIMYTVCILYQCPLYTYFMGTSQLSSVGSKIWDLKVCPFWGGFSLKVHYLLHTTYPSDMFPSRRISRILTTCPNVGLFLASAFQHSSMHLYTGSGQSYISRNTLMFIHKSLYWASCYVFNHVSNVTDAQY